METLHEKRLNFSKEYLKKLLSGKKLMTIRRGKRKFEVGEEVDVYCAGKRIGRVKIVSIRYKTLPEINLEDVKKDGFKSKRKLKKALRKHYRRLKKNDVYTLIEFEWMEKVKKHESL